MRLGSDSLVAIIGVFRKGLMEGVDVSELLRKLELVEKDGKIGLSPQQQDIWTVEE